MSRDRDRLLNFLYGSAVGRALLRPLISPRFARLGGRLLDTGLSALVVKRFVRTNQIDLSQCRKQRFSSWNDFFTRELLPGARPVDETPEAFVSPCDGRLSVYPVEEGGRFQVKRAAYTLPRLLGDEALARRYLGGLVWLYRLSLEDYHHYIYPDDGRRGESARIPGRLNTVQPVANDWRPVYHENTREYCLLETAHFGPVVMMEVGAMLVGRIENRPCGETVCRGQEKGNFAFGGSTILLLTEKGAVTPDPALMESARAGQETAVRLGQRVGTGALLKN